MNKVIFIHGLSWKPPKATLVERYNKHLAESLQGASLLPDTLSVAYWADLVDKHDPEGEHDEYEEPNGRFEPLEGRDGFVRDLRGRLRTSLVNLLGDSVGRFFQRPDTDDQQAIAFLAGKGLSGVSRPLYELFLEEIDRYLKASVRAQVKGRLLAELRATPAGAKVCLIAHSMGSMIAADVLASEEVTVDLLLTIGSPLGITVLHRQLDLDGDDAKARMRRNVGRWVNLYDHLDPIALDHDLRDDFPHMGIKDVVVENDFVKSDGKRNHHKSYGYLRTPELGRLVGDFLNS